MMLVFPTSELAMGYVSIPVELLLDFFSCYNYQVRCRHRDKKKIWAVSSGFALRLGTPSPRSAVS
jgi:hypothetical protein